MSWLKSKSSALPEAPEQSTVSSIKPGAAVKASDLFVRALENEGVEYVFAVPGEENLDLLDSLKNLFNLR